MFIDVDTKLPLVKITDSFQRANGDAVIISDGVLDLRPAVINVAEKIKEDEIHSVDSKYTSTDIFYEIIYKKGGYIKDFLENWLNKIKPYLQPGNVFLEVGGGLNYVSALVKDKFPKVVVCASDISPQYLSKKSKVLAETFFTRIPDYYLACDAESLPFKDKSVDVIWTHSSLHHFGDATRFLIEARRILKENSKLFALDTADPYLPFLNNKYKIKKEKRAKELGIFEHSYSIFEWQKIGKKAGMKASYAEGKKIKNVFFKFLLNAFRPSGIFFQIDK